MNNDWQTYVALLVVLVAAVLLTRSFLRKRHNPGCSSGGCPTDEFKNRNRKRFKAHHP